MNRRVPSFFLILLLLPACQRHTAPPIENRPPAAPIAAPAPPRLAGLAAKPPSAERIAAGRRWMEGGGREEPCGPYRLITDVDDPQLVAACDRIGAELDAIFEQRFGVRPVGSPAEGILLFRRLRDYNAFVREEGRLAAGYAGFSSGSLVALHASPPRAEVIQTLAHELTHLVEHRAFGLDLPPWLSEGLANAIGHTATTSGFGPLDGWRGAEALAQRLRQAQTAGEERPFAELAGLPRSAFDRGVRSFDYEQSTLWVRYLLLDPHLGPGFRSFLADLAGIPEGHVRYDAERLRERLGRSWLDLESGFRSWLGTERPRRP
jgi:hypothetical protein